jgi:hypothetical protein
MEEKPRVMVEHYRYMGEDPAKCKRYMRGFGFPFDLYGDGKITATHTSKPLPNGGRTYAYVMLIGLVCNFNRPTVRYVWFDGKELIAESVCSVQDSFNYKLGRTIAMGRLRKQLELWGLVDQVDWP